MLAKSKFGAVLFQRIKNTVTSKPFPIVVSLLAFFISVFGFLYNLNRDLEIDRLQMAYDLVDQNFEVNMNIQILRCMNGILNGKEKEFSSIYAFSPTDEKNHIKDILQFSRSDINKSRIDLLSTKHYYKIEINKKLIDLAKEFQADQFENAKYICSNHTR